MKFLYGRPRHTPDEFFNHEELLLISDYIKDRRQSYMIVGPRRTGKTSLLHVLGHNLRKQGMLTTFVDLEEGRAEGFLTPVLFSRLYGFTMMEDYLEQVGLTKKVGLSIKKFVNEAGSKVIAGLSSFLERIKKVEVKAGDELGGYINLHIDMESRALERRPYSQIAEKALTEALDLPERLAEAADREIAVMIDEFQFLKDLKQALPGVLHLLRSKYQSHRRTAYLVSGSAVGLVTDMVASKSEPFYGFFLVQTIRPFDEKTSANFLDEGFATEGLKAPPDTLNYIIEHCDGLPAWLNYMGLESSRIAHLKRERSVSPQTVRRVSGKMMSDAAVVGALERDLTMLEAKVKSRRITETLRIVCRSGKPVAALDVWSLLKEKERRPMPQPKTYEYLNRLIDFGFLEKTEEGLFRCVDPILAEFVGRSYRYR